LPEGLKKPNDAQSQYFPHSAIDNLRRRRSTIHFE